MVSGVGHRGLGYLLIVSALVGLLLWMQPSSADDYTEAVRLSPQDRTWLAEHPKIVLAPKAWIYPFEFFDDNGTYRGVAADYIALLEKRLGIHFTILQTKTLEQWQTKVRSGAVDILAATAPNSSPVAWMQVTRPHIVFPGVIVSANEYPDLQSLRGKKVAVTGQQWGAFVSASSPQIQLVSLPDTATALETISRGEVSALVSDMATVSYYIHREGMTDIRIVGRLAKDLELGISIRKDWPELNLIMQKALDSISDAEREAIARQWIHLKVPSLIIGKTFWILLVSSLTTVLLILFGFFLWNRSLRLQVAARTQNLKQELGWRTAAEQEIQEAYERLTASHNELKVTQRQLVRAAKMESVGSLAAGVAHEVKNPLMQIRLGLDYLDAKICFDRTGREVVQEMVVAVDRADSVLNSLLDFSRESELTRRLCHVSSLVDDSLKLVRHELTKNKIEVVRLLEEHLPKILVDENKIHQAFINLFQNAAQAMPEGGKVRISARLGGLPGKNVIVVDISDTGAGVEAELLEKVFDPFYTTKPVGRGTGLGLYVTRNILELHDAKIEFHNLDEGGLQVRVRFPV